MAYEVVLLDSARQVIRELAPAAQQLVAQSLREELECQESDSTVLIHDWSIDPERPYFAAELSSSYLAVFRCMAIEELDDLRRQQDREVLPEGRQVFDLLPGSL
jgi:hypothetical protein